MATTPPPAVAEALARLLKDADWLMQQGSEQDRQCIADVRTLARHIQAGMIGCPRHLGAPSGVCSHPDCMREHLQAGAGPGGERAREALVALAVPCEALLRAEAAGEVAGMRPVLSEDVSKALKAGVILLRRALLPPPASATETEER